MLYRGNVLDLCHQSEMPVTALIATVVDQTERPADIGYGVVAAPSTGGE